MRITGGTYRGRSIEAPPGRATRPTGGKVREAIFNMLAARNGLENAVAADLFCGSGALGLEALSCGADYVTFVDNSRQALKCVSTNARALGIDDARYAIRHNTLPQLPAFASALTHIFLDPPYNKDVIGSTLEALIAQDCLRDDALIVCETGGTCEEIARWPDLLVKEREKHYGDTVVTLLAYHRYAGT